jgi:hypothetical protein
MLNSLIKKLITVDSPGDNRMGFAKEKGPDSLD